MGVAVEWVAKILESWDEEAGEAAAEANREGDILQAGLCDLLALLFLLFEDLHQSASEWEGVAGEIEFKIEPEAAGVPVGGAETAPSVINEEKLGVIKWGRGFVDVAASF